MDSGPFFEAVQSGDQQEVERQLDRQPGLLHSRTQSGVSAVLLAIYYGNLQIADLLIQRGAELDIFEAAAAGQLERVVELLDSDASLVNAYAPDGFQPLGLASFFGRKPVVDALLGRGAQVSSASRNSQSVQPLHSAVAGGHYEIAKALLEHGADVNACQSGGFTPLHGAAQNGQLEMIRLLIEHKADLHTQSFDGKTALDFAEQSGHEQAADLLRSLL
ncbi:MAG: ankyrin repeat domain-containing protein [Anaerolineales bacterium]